MLLWSTVACKPTSSATDDHKGGGSEDSSSSDASNEGGGNEGDGEDLSDVNRLVDCPLPDSVESSAVYGTLVKCEDDYPDGCGDGCPCDSEPRAADYWEVWVGTTSSTSSAVKATLCYDQEQRDATAGETNPGWPYRFAYSAEVLTPNKTVYVWMVTDWGFPMDECYERSEVQLDDMGVAVLSLTGRDVDHCQ